MRTALWLAVSVVVLLGLPACRKQSGTGSAARSPGATAGSGAADSNQLTCKIGGADKAFSHNAKVLVNAEDGLILVGFGDANDGEVLSLHVPHAKQGRFTLADTPGLSLDYTTNLYASDSGDHYRGSSGDRDTLVDVNVTRLGRPGERIEGTFSARVTSSSPHPTYSEITEGVFSVKRSRPPRR